MRQRRLTATTILFFITLAISLWTHSHSEPALIATTSRAPLPPGYVRVAHAIDGDTIELEDGTHVRYIGIDTPETVHPTKPVQCYGHEASDANHALVDGQAVRLVSDKESTDHYGRDLRYIYLEDGTFVNLALVTEGYARAYSYAPNTAHKAEFAAAQTQAKKDARGLWNACPQ